MAPKKRRAAFSALMALALAAGLLASCVPPAAARDPVTVTILQTSDIHGMLYPYDYASNAETASGMAHIASAVARERELDPELLLVDTGDIAQGNYIHEFRAQSPHPAVAALDHLQYDVWAPGNHEFNFEYEYLERAIAGFGGTVLMGNAYTAEGGRWQKAWKIFELKGVRVALFGLVAPHIPRWESTAPEHYDQMTFTEPIDETGKLLDELDGKADAVVGCIHYGMEGEYGSEGARAIAEAYADRLDALLIGHTHESVNETVCGVPILEPASGGEYLSKLTLTLEYAGGAWTVNKEKSGGELIDAAAFEPDAAFLRAFEPLHESSLALASSKVGEVGETFLKATELLPGIPVALIQDNPILDLISIVFMEASGADAAHACLLDASANLEKGDFLHRDGTKVYKYANTLFTVRVTGAQLKAIMEKHAGGFYDRYRPGDVTIGFNEEMRMYEFDAFAGVEYEIDISKPPGERIIDLRFRGRPLEAGDELTLALSNYRCGSLMKEGLIRREQILYEGGDIQTLITEYVAGLDGPLMPECDNNWRIVGAPLDDPQKELIYDMVRRGELTVPASADGRTPNTAALNGPQLRAEGKLPPLEP